MQDSFSREKNNITKINPDLNTYVSRGGYKIEGAFKDFQMEASGKKIIDIGASTGGFTDFLLRAGADKVITIDVGYGILDWKLRNNPSVFVHERTNVRYLERDKLEFLADLTVVDVSFISVKTIFSKILEFTKEKGEILILLKPQFEVSKHEVEKGGVIRNKRLHTNVVSDTVDFILNNGLLLNDLSFSKIRGAKGNIEFWLYLKKEFYSTDLNIKKTVTDYDKIINSIVEKSHKYFQIL